MLPSTSLSLTRYTYFCVCLIIVPGGSSCHNSNNVPFGMSFVYSTKGKIRFSLIYTFLSYNRPSTSQYWLFICISRLDNTDILHSVYTENPMLKSTRRHVWEHNPEAHGVDAPVPPLTSGLWGADTRSAPLLLASVHGLLWGAAGLSTCYSLQGPKASTVFHAPLFHSVPYSRFLGSLHK